MDGTMVTCACADCVCVVKTEAAVEKEGRLYFSPGCADHNKDGSGCRHAGCTSHG